MIDSKFIEINKWISTKLLKDLENNEIATDELKFSFINLKNLNKSHIIELEDIEPLFNSSKELNINMFKTEYGKDLFKLYMHYNNDDEFITEAYLHERYVLDNKSREARIIEEAEARGKTEGKAEGILEGKAKGLVEGKAEKAIAIAKNMLAKNLDVNFISECTGLSVLEIKNLK